MGETLLDSESLSAAFFVFSRRQSEDYSLVPMIRRTRGVPISGRPPDQYADIPAVSYPPPPSADV